MRTNREPPGGRVGPIGVRANAVDPCRDGIRVVAVGELVEAIRRLSKQNPIRVNLLDSHMNVNRYTRLASGVCFVVAALMLLNAAVNPTGGSYTAAVLWVVAAALSHVVEKGVSYA